MRKSGIEVWESQRQRRPALISQIVRSGSSKILKNMQEARFTVRGGKVYNLELLNLSGAGAGELLVTQEKEK